MHTVRVNLGPRSYDIALVSADPAGIGPFARLVVPRATAALLVTDSNLQLGHAAQVSLALGNSGLRVGMAVVPAGETSKSLAHAAELYDQLADLPADRNTLVVAVGGGVVGDLA